MTVVTRRSLVTTALAASAFPLRARAADAIKIGMPLALTGPLGSVGQQMKNGAELWAKVENAKGGLLGRPIQLFITDTAGDPSCVRLGTLGIEFQRSTCGRPPFVHQFRARDISHVTLYRVNICQSSVGGSIA